MKGTEGRTLRGQNRKGMQGKQSWFCLSLMTLNASHRLRERRKTVANMRAWRHCHAWMMDWHWEELQNGRQTCAVCWYYSLPFMDRGTERARTGESSNSCMRGRESKGIDTWEGDFMLCISCSHAYIQKTGTGSWIIIGMAHWGHGVRPAAVSHVMWVTVIMVICILYLLYMFMSCACMMCYELHTQANVKKGMLLLKPTRRCAMKCPYVKIKMKCHVSELSSLNEDAW